MSVYRVTEVIGTSPTSWEEAAKEALTATAGSLRDLRVAEVSKLDITLTPDGKIVATIGGVAGDAGGAGRVERHGFRAIDASARR